MFSYSTNITIENDSDKITGSLHIDNLSPMLALSSSMINSQTLFTIDTVSYTPKNKLTDENGNEYIYLCRTASFITNISLWLVYSPTLENFLIIPDIDYYNPTTDKLLRPDLRAKMSGGIPKSLNGLNEQVFTITTDVYQKLPEPTKIPDTFKVYGINTYNMVNKYRPNVSISVSDTTALRFDHSIIQVLELDLTALYDDVPETATYRVVNERLSRIDLAYIGKNKLDKVYIPILI